MLLNSNHVERFLSNHVIVLRIPKNVDASSLVSNQNDIQNYRLIDDPTSIDTKAAMLKYQDSDAARFGVLKLSLYLKKTPMVAMQAYSFLLTCAEHLKNGADCSKKRHRIVAKSLNPGASDLIHLKLFSKFGAIVKYKFLFEKEVLETKEIVVEYSCAIEALAAQISLDGFILNGFKMAVDRIPNCIFEVPKLKRIFELIESDQYLLNIKNEYGAFRKMLSDRQSFAKASNIGKGNSESEICDSELDETLEFIDDDGVDSVFFYPSGSECESSEMKNLEITNEKLFDSDSKSNAGQKTSITENEQTCKNWSKNVDEESVLIISESLVSVLSFENSDSPKILKLDENVAKTEPEVSKNSNKNDVDEKIVRISESDISENSDIPKLDQKVAENDIISENSNQNDVKLGEKFVESSAFVTKSKFCVDREVQTPKNWRYFETHRSDFNTREFRNTTMSTRSFGRSVSRASRFARKGHGVKVINGRFQSADREFCPSVNNSTNQYVRKPRGRFSSRESGTRNNTTLSGDGRNFRLNGHSKSTADFRLKYSPTKPQINNEKCSRSNNRIFPESPQNSNNEDNKSSVAKSSNATHDSACSKSSADCRSKTKAKTAKSGQELNEERTFEFS